MKTTRILPPIIAPTLEVFFDRNTDGLPPREVARQREVLDHLVDYLEGCDGSFLTTGQLAVLRAERASNPDRAFVRTMRTDDLFYALYGYLDAENALEPVELRRAQVRFVEQLCTWMWAEGHVSLRFVSDCMAIDVRLRLEHAVRELG